MITVIKSKLEKAIIEAKENFAEGVTKTEQDFFKDIQWYYSAYTNEKISKSYIKYFMKLNTGA